MEFAKVSRLKGDSITTVNRLGPLADLLGTWVGTGDGWNVIAVPDTQDLNKFKLEANQYNETITFHAGPSNVPNKGGKAGLQTLQAVEYHLNVNEVTTDFPLHGENGMWLLLDDTDTPIARQAIVPHGNSILMMGSAETINSAPPISDISAIPLDKHKQPITSAAYLAQYESVAKNIFADVVNPNKVLQDILKGQTVTSTTTPNVSTEPNGGIVNIPFIKANANATTFSTQFWIESVVNAEGHMFQQLQYTQITMIFFHNVFWPHININTLVKQ